MLTSSVSLSTALILLEVFLGGASITLTIPDAAHYLAAGILEWIVAFLGTVYLWLYCGLLDRWVILPAIGLYADIMEEKLRARFAVAFAAEESRGTSGSRSQAVACG